MASGWENLRRQSGVSEDIVRQIEDVSSGADEVQRQSPILCGQTQSIIVGINQVRISLSTPRFNSSSSELSNVPGGAQFDHQISAMMDPLNAIMAQALL